MFSKKNPSILHGCAERSPTAKAHTETQWAARIPVDRTAHGSAAATQSGHSVEYANGL
jgi:predicted HicB family RNase H-like nuclease